MPRTARIVAVDYHHHITQRGVSSIVIFKNDSDRNQYLRFIKEEAERHDLEIIAWRLMTNHVHFVAVPHNETSLSQ